MVPTQSRNLCEDCIYQWDNLFNAHGIYVLHSPFLHPEHYPNVFHLNKCTVNKIVIYHAIKTNLLTSFFNLYQSHWQHYISTTWSILPVYHILCHFWFDGYKRIIKKKMVANMCNYGQFIFVYQWREGSILIQTQFHSKEINFNIWYKSISWLSVSYSCFIFKRS